MNLSAISELSKRKWLAALAAGVLFFLYVIVGHLAPLLGEILELRADVVENGGKLAQAGDWEFTIKKLQGKKRTLLKKIDTLVVGQSGGQPSRILAVLSSRARENGIELLTLEPEVVRKTESNSEFGIKLTAKSRYHHLCRYIYDLETSEPVVRIRSLDLRSENMGSSRIVVEMDLIVYFLEKSP